MSRSIILPLRVLQVMLAVANLGLSSFVVHWYITGSRRSSPSSINFLIFAPIFSIASVIYLEVVPRKAPRAAHPFASLAVEGLNTLFYFAGFIAFAVFISQLAFCNGSVCAAGRADVVIAAAEFSAWIVSTILLAKDIFKGGLRSPAPAPTAPPSNPQMSQAAA